MYALTGLLIACLAVAAYGLPATHIVGGRDAPLGKYPHQASLRYLGSHICGGSIISKRYILTAAHCIADPMPDSFMTIQVGTNSLEKGGVSYEVEERIAHKDYNPYTITNDIGLIRVKTDIKFTSQVQPIALAPAGPTFEGKACVLTGWGTLSVGGRTPTNLQEIDLIVDTQKNCEKHFGNVLDSHICTFTKVGEGACHGDSGGPLISGNVQIGIVSFGNPCAVGSPDVYTRVSSFRTWIAENQKP